MKHKIVRVEWVDSCTTGRWHDRDYKCGLCNIITVGILVGNTKDTVSVTHSYDSYSDSVCDRITIPKCSIKSKAVIGSING